MARPGYRNVPLIRPSTPARRHIATRYAHTAATSKPPIKNMLRVATMISKRAAWTWKLRASTPSMFTSEKVRRCISQTARGPIGPKIPRPCTSPTQPRLDWIPSGPKEATVENKRTPSQCGKLRKQPLAYGINPLRRESHGVVSPSR